MPSSGRPGLVDLLRSQGLGVACGQAAALLFAVGSLVITATREGASAQVRMDDIRAFFTDPSPWHAWFYLLLGVMTLYAVNMALCTWDNVVARWRAGQRRPAAYAAAIVHVGFLLALLAHLVGGTLTEDGEPIVLSSRPTAAADGRLLRLAGLDYQPNPDGTPRSVVASVEITEPDGRVHTESIGFNQPLSAGLGTDLLLLGRLGRGGTVQLNPRHAPANPLALLAGLLMVLGFGLMARRWLPLPPASPPRPAPTGPLRGPGAPAAHGP